MLEKTKLLLKDYKAGTFVDDSVQCYDEDEIRELGMTLANLVYSPSKLRKRLQDFGATITRTDFYSELPLIAEVEETFRSDNNIDFGSVFPDNNFLLDYLAELAVYSSEFDPPLTSSKSTEFSWNHGPFSYSDAVAYYSMIRKNKPASIVEIGSGSSTLIAIQALQRNGGGRLIAIEPYPQDFLKLIPSSIELVQLRAQDVKLEFLNNALTDNSILFIDSTHTVRHNSDCLHIYLRLLPYIEKNIFVHVHDIYLPSTLPIEMMRDRNLFWNEQYLLCAYLARNPTTKVLYGSRYHYHRNSERLREFMQGKFPHGGASFWFFQSTSNIGLKHTTTLPQISSGESQ